MGKRSIRKDKNIYQLTREENGLTREKAAELMEYISADRIEKIESEKSLPHPDEILAMAKCYKRPVLRNYFCSHECPIGQVSVTPLEIKDLSRIILEMLDSLNQIDGDKNRLIEITADGRITEDEYRDFVEIRSKLDRISMTINSLQLWVDQTIADGYLDAEKLTQY